MAEKCKDGCVVEPFPSDGCVVEPSCDMSLGDSELKLFDSIAAEHINIVGTPVDFFAQDIAGATRDALYDEPVARVFKGPYTITCFAEFPAAAMAALEQGAKKEWDSSIWIPRSSLEEASAPYPKEGDVVRFWNLPYFNKDSVLHDEHVPGAGYFFDVTLADDDGHLFDTPSFVGFKLTVRRNTDFTPERRMTPP